MEKKIERKEKEKRGPGDGARSWGRGGGAEALPRDALKAVDV